MLLVGFKELYRQAQEFKFHSLLFGFVCLHGKKKDISFLYATPQHDLPVLPLPFQGHLLETPSDLQHPPCPSPLPGRYRAQPLESKHQENPAEHVPKGGTQIL